LASETETAGSTGNNSSSSLFPVALSHSLYCCVQDITTLSGSLCLRIWTRPVMMVCCYLVFII